MSIPILFGAAVLGLLVGGVVNALVMRTRESLMFTVARSCAICAEPASGLEYLPLFGYFAVRRRCGGCQAVIPWQYPATEAAFALLFLVFAARAAGVWSDALPDFVLLSEGWLLFIRDAIVVTALVLVFVFDYRASLIPDRITIPAIIAVIVLNLALGMDPVIMLLGGLFLGGFFAIQFLFSNGRWVGGGDVRVGMLMGFLLGPWIGITAMLAAYILGAVVGVWLVTTKRRTLGSHVPFGTFMAMATILAMLCGEQIMNWYLNLLS